MSASPGTADLHIFAVRVLHQIGAPVTKANLRFINAWAHREGTSARFNPLATTQPESGASSFNSVGVRNYTSLSEGARATATTLQNGDYGDVLHALRGGHPSLRTHFAGLKTWSGGGYDNLAGEPTGNMPLSAKSSGIPTKIGGLPVVLIAVILIVLILVLRK